MKNKKKSDLAILLDYAGSRKGLTFLGLALSAVSMLLSMAPYICIWLAARDLIAAAPDWTRAQNVTRWGWLAFAFAVGGIVLYFAGLMCTHLAAFRTAANIRKRGMAHMMKAPLGFVDANASGLIRGRLDAAAADMLRHLRGRTHEVLTGLAVLPPDGAARTLCTRTRVTFRDFAEDELAAYLATGEPLDKAGAYGIQGRGALLVAGIEGDYYSVMGLLVAPLYEVLRGLGALRVG